MKKQKRKTAKKSSMVPTPMYKAEDKKWQARNDLDTLTRAEEIKRDTARHKAAITEARRRQEELRSVTGAKPRDEKEMEKYAEHRDRNEKHEMMET